MKFTAINGWRFICALLILWHHMPVWKPVGAAFGNPIVTFFFVLSGFLITHSYRDLLLNKIVGTKEFIIKRCATIFPLQWLFTILFVVFSINVVSYWAVPFHLTLTQSLLPFWEIDFTLNTPSWFLSSIFVCYLLTPLLLRIRDRKCFMLIFIFMLLFWHSFLFLLPESIGRRWLCYISPFARIFDYGMGILLALYWTKIKNLLVKSNGVCYNTMIELIAIGLMSLCLLRPHIMGIEKLIGIGSPLLSLMMCMFISVFCMSNGPISKFLSIPIFNKLGAMSIAIYMCHGFVMHYTNDVVEYSIVCYIFLTLSIVLLFSFLLEKYYCRYMKNIIIKLFSRK